MYRLWLKRNGQVLKTSRNAKWKTAFQLTFLIALLLFLTGAHTVEPVVSWMEVLLASDAVFWALVVVTAVTVLTGIDYFIKPETGLESDLNEP
jgi:CDP-diacylglycerol--glycerol-3-phosphate 3-phosphatidyltransferase